MRLIIGGLLVGAAIIGGGIYAYNAKISRNCADWISGAERAVHNGFYAEGMAQLKPFFSTEKCRGESDSVALDLLSEARPHVVLPENAHLAQSLMLARLGVKSTADNRDYLALASAALASGRYEDAVRYARKLASGEGVLIELAAFIGMNDHDQIDLVVQRIMTGDTSPFQKALVYYFLKISKRTPTPEPEMVADIDPTIYRLAAYVAGQSQNEGRNAETLAASFKPLAQDLTDDDLSIATMLLIARQDLISARALLDQPYRALPAKLLSGLARVLWSTDQSALLPEAFFSRLSVGSMLGEVYLLVCLNERRMRGACGFHFDEQDYQKRHGVFAASRWASLLKALERGDEGTADAIDAMNAMPSLLASVPVSFSLKAALFADIGEDLLAKQYRGQAKAYGFVYDLSKVEPDDTPSALSCAKGDQECLGAYVTNQQDDLWRWSQAIAQGFMPSPEQAELLRGYSPDEALLWRKTVSHHLIKRGGEENLAQALAHLKEGTSSNSADPMVHLLAGVSYALLGDSGAAMTAFVDAVRADASVAVVAMRSALGLFQDGQHFSAKELVHIWVSLSRVEMKARQAGIEGDRVTVERLSLLAAVGIEGQSQELLSASYEALLQIDPNNHMALNNLAYLLFEQNKDLKRAYQLAEKAVRLDRENPEYTATLRDVSERLEQLEAGR